MERPRPGLYCVVKQVSETSFSHVRRFQEALDASPGKSLKVCHGGVLDPFAQGLLLMLVGSATRLFDHLHDIPKVYRASIAWGAETDSGDHLGTVLERSEVTVTHEALVRAIDQFHGWTDQIPPAASNVRVQGERAYARHQRGEVVQLDARKVYLHHARVLTHDEGARSSVVELSVRGGFYVRAFARDVARTLGSRAHLSGLERTQIGPWQVPTETTAPERPVPVSQLLSWLPTRTLTDAEWGVFRSGEFINVAPLAPPSWSAPADFPIADSTVRVMHLDRLVALGAVEPDGQCGMLVDLPGLL